jgi:hypothetical protein
MLMTDHGRVHEEGIVQREDAEVRIVAGRDPALPAQAWLAAGLAAPSSARERPGNGLRRPRAVNTRAGIMNRQCNVY